MKDENIARIKQAKNTLEEVRANTNSLKMKFRVDSALEELEWVVE
ncbi:MAG: hypothetical protein V5A88_10305 [Candidatus Thermoplasmatota archaeon]